MQKETQIQSLEVRNSKYIKWAIPFALLVSIVISIFIIKGILSKKFWLDFQPLSLGTFALLVALIWGIIYYSKSFYYEKQIQLKINKDGIMIINNQTLLWDDIWYFNTKDENMGRGGRLNTLEIKLKEGVDYKKDFFEFPLDNYDKSKEEIRSIIEYYAAIHDVKDLGHEIIG